MAIFVGDIGTKIILDVGLDISGASVRSIQYGKPDGGVGGWMATEESSTTISFTTIVGSLDVSGTWKLQAYVEKAGWKRHGEIARLVVSPIIGA